MSDALPIPGTIGYFVDDTGAIFSNRTGKMRSIKPWRHKFGYGVFSVLLVSGKRRHMLVHRAVALAFHGQPPEGKPEVRHLDGNCHNNTPGNIAWGSHAENMRDMLRHGTHVSISKPERMPRGESHGWVKHPESIQRGEQRYNASLTDTHVRAIRLMRELGFSIAHIARSLEASRDAVKMVVHGKSWKHVA